MTSNKQLAALGLAVGLVGAGHTADADTVYPFQLTNVSDQTTVGALNSVVSLYYYARIVRTMFLDQPTGDEEAVSLDWSTGGLVGVLTLGTVVFGDRGVGQHPAG